jgi:hypothetical protein
LSQAGGELGSSSLEVSQRASWAHPFSLFGSGSEAPGDFSATLLGICWGFTCLAGQGVALVLALGALVWRGFFRAETLEPVPCMPALSRPFNGGGAASSSLEVSQRAAGEHIAMGGSRTRTEGHKLKNSLPHLEPEPGVRARPCNGLACASQH